MCIVNSKTFITFQVTEKICRDFEKKTFIVRILLHLTKILSNIQTGMISVKTSYLTNRGVNLQMQKFAMRKFVRSSTDMKTN